jgi:hypothetical protein
MGRSLRRSCGSVVRAVSSGARRFWLPIWVLPLASCFGGGSGSGSGSLAGTYTGFMQEVGNGHVLDYSLAQEVTVSETNDVAVEQLTFSSSAFPSFQAIVLDVGPAAVNLQLVGLNANAGVQLQEVAFTKGASGNWILLIQTAGQSAPGATTPSLVQYVSYDPASAPPATEVAAVNYLDGLLAVATRPAGP